MGQADEKERPERPDRGQALKVRERVKAKKPDFRREESWRYKRLKPSWRKPRGVDSKMRKSVKGWPRSPGAGYRGPRGARGLHPSGYGEVLVHSVDDVEGVDPETQAARIAHTVGERKRLDISARAKERGIRILNPREEREPEEAEGQRAEGGEEG